MFLFRRVLARHGVGFCSSHKEIESSWWIALTFYFHWSLEENCNLSALHALVKRILIALTWHDGLEQLRDSSQLERLQSIFHWCLRLGLSWLWLADFRQTFHRLVIVEPQTFLKVSNTNIISKLFHVSPHQLYPLLLCILPSSNPHPTMAYKQGGSEPRQ